MKRLRVLVLFQWLFLDKISFVTQQKSKYKAVSTSHDVFFTHLEAIENLIKIEFLEMEFEPRFKSAKTRFKLSAGLNLETFDTI